MSNKEAAARIKINKLLEAAGWRFFADANGPATIQLEPSVTLTKQVLDGLGENFEKAAKGFIDFLLLGEKGLPLKIWLILCSCYELCNPEKYRLPPLSRWRESAVLSAKS